MMLLFALYKKLVLTKLRYFLKIYYHKEFQDPLLEPELVSLACLLACLLTPWCRILFEKLIVTQLVKKYPAFLWNPKVHYRVHKSPPLDPILSQLNTVRPIDPYLPKVHLNVILPPTPRSSQWSLAFRPPNQNPVNTSPLPMRATCTVHIILLDLITLTIFGEEYRL
jgi:hypothetical protein